MFSRNMQFTPTEAKLIERLRKQERRWPRTRWMLLALAGFAFAAYGYIAYQMFSRLDSSKFPNQDSALMVAFFWPKCLVGLLFGAWFLSLAIRDWKGNVNRMLLLKLLDAQKTESGSHGHDI